MAGFESPIELSVNTNRLFMEGLRAQLDLHFRNLDAAETFDVELAVQCCVLETPRRILLSLDGSTKRRRRIELILPRSGPESLGSAGELRFEVDLIVNAGEDGRHRFYGEFTLGVLAYSENRSSVNVSIGKLIEQHGDKAGMGAINEVDLRNFIKMPEYVSVNDLLQQTREARFVPIDLEYLGLVEEIATPHLLDADAHPLERCTLAPERSGPRTLLLSGDSITLGRNRRECDLVTWRMPRSDEHDTMSRMISGRHVALHRTPVGLRIVPLSRTNQTMLDGSTIPLEGTMLHRPVGRLSLASKLELELTCLPALIDTPPIEIPAAISQTWLDGARCGIGGVLITRCDEFADREQYLWVWSMVDAPVGSGNDSVRLASLTRLAVMSERDGTNPRALRRGGVIEAGEARLRVEEFHQDLDIREDPLQDETIRQ